MNFSTPTNQKCGLAFLFFRKSAESMWGSPNSWLVPRIYSAETVMAEKKTRTRAQSSSPITTPPLNTHARSSLPPGTAISKPSSRPQSPLASPASSLRLDLNQKSTPGSPSSQTLSESFSQGDSPEIHDIDVDSSQSKTKPRTYKKTQCPCGKSSL